MSRPLSRQSAAIASDPNPDEWQGLLSGTRHDVHQYGTLSSDGDGQSPSKERRQIGVFSAVFIIFNRIIGTGIFATPSMILRLSGSVGLSLVMWLVGAIIAAAGMQVYIIWGTALPYNGGEKNYLEFLFPKPRRLVTSMYAANAVLLAYAAGNSLVFAEYALAAFAPDSVQGSPLTVPDTSSLLILSPVRIVAFSCLTGVLLLHGLHVPAGLRLQNFLGVLKIGILFITVGAGVVAASGRLQEGVEPPRNFDSWATIWEGSKGGGSVLCLCLYNVIWSYVGFSNANYALSEMHRPGRTLRIAGPLALVFVTIFYFAANLAYFSAASKEEITGSGRLVAALLFKNVWGSRTERVLSIFVALSALGNVLSVSFSQGRVNQALGKEGVLIFNRVWASGWPRRAPLAGLALHWAACNVVVFALPAGDAYNFVINVISYPLAAIHATISFGLIYLSLESSVDKPWSRVSRLGQQVLPNLQPSPSSRGSVASASVEVHGSSDSPNGLEFSPSIPLLLPSFIFGLANVFLIVVPWTKPPPGAEPYEKLPYWTHAVGGWAVFLIGAVWWILRIRLKNRKR